MFCKMSCSRDFNELHKSLGLLINIGEKLVDKCEEHKHISGVGKLLKNCKAELNYLKKLSQKEKFSEAVLKSSNLSNLQGIALCAEHLSNVVAVLRPLQMPNSPHPIVVDVVCNGGRTWVKVITKNSKALLANVNEQCHFGTRSIKEQASKYLEFAKLHPFQFKVPEVVFVFFHPVPQKMEEGLSELGIQVKRSEEVVSKDLLLSELCCNIFKDLGFSREGTSEDFDSFDDGKSDDEYDVDGDEDDGDDEGEESCADDRREEQKIVQSRVPATTEDSSAGPRLGEYPEMIATREFLDSICANSHCICKSYVGQLSDAATKVFPLVDRVNLDVTSLIAVVSNLCHGYCDFKFREKYLTLQAQDEQSNPTLPKVFELFLGRSLFSCQTAVRDFEKIVGIVGGDEEKDRAKQLLKGIFVVPDLSSGKCDKLQESARINPRMRTIFGTGDSLEAVTCTANNGFVRASMQAGVEFVAFIHPARALTEQKQDSADSVKRGDLQTI